MCAVSHAGAASMRTSPAAIASTPAHNSVMRHYLVRYKSAEKFREFW